MYRELQEYLQYPALYERTTEKFWTDPYITTQMLKAHLDPTVDAASYKPELIDCSVKWILSLLPENARLLDIGCGPGLYTKKFAEHGLLVTGLDFSENSINYAREHDCKSQYIVGDYLEMDINDSFDIVTLIMCDYGALIPDERHSLLRRVHRALKSRGLFLFDVFTPLKGKGKHNVTSWDMNPDDGFWSAKPYICLTSENYYGEIAESRRHVIVDETGVRCYNLWDCYFTKQSLVDEVVPFGFSDVGFYNDITGKSYTDDTQTMCAVFRKG